MSTAGSKKPRRQPILEIVNRHADPAPDMTLKDGAYVSYFENELGEQWIFIRERGADTGTVYGGDVGWEGHKVRFRSSAEIRDELASQGARKSMIDRMIALTNPDPLIPGLVLQSGEKAWLSTAWWASSSIADRGAELEAIAMWVAEQIPIEMLDKHPNTTDYRATQQTLTLLIGRAAGMRGLNDAETSKLLTAVFNLVSKRNRA